VPGRRLPPPRWVPVLPVSGDVLLAGAGALAGLVGTAGGITSLVSYSALLWVGIAPLQANITNTIALVACWPGSAIASRPELAGRGRWLGRWGTVAATGGTAGSLLLLSTPPGVFSRVVPFLIVAGTAILLAQPRITARTSREPGQPGGKLLLPCGLVALSGYNGYFGAGSGMMTLALMLLTTDARVPRANALKNMLVGAATITSAVLFAIVARVDWAAAAPLAAGLLAGSTAGPWAARRLPPALIRWLAALSGIALAAWLWAG